MERAELVLLRGASDLKNMESGGRFFGENDSESRGQCTQSTERGTDVCVRLRPMLPFEQESGDGALWRCERDKVVRKGGSVAVHFQGKNVFGPEATNGRIFKRCVAPALEDMCRGRPCAVIAVGGEGSGKKYTMHGAGEEEGVLWLSLQLIFKEASQMKGVTGIAISYCEIHNEVDTSCLRSKAELHHSVSLILPASGILPSRR